MIDFIKETGGKLFGHREPGVQKVPRRWVADSQSAPDASSAPVASANERDSSNVERTDRQSAIWNKYYRDSEDGVLSKQDAWLHSP